MTTMALAAAMIPRRNTSRGAPAYTADGWIVSATGANITVDKYTGAGINTPQYVNSAMHITGATSNTDVIVKQRIEGVIAASLQSQQVTVQFALNNQTDKLLRMLPKLLQRN